jgi:hypothetical protein
MFEDDGPSQPGEAARPGLGGGQNPYELVTLPRGWQVGRFGGLSAMPGLVHAVTTRRGLDVRVVAADRDAAARQVADALGLNGVAFCKQVHGNAVHRVDGPGLAGEGDALVTDTPGLGLMCFSADCPLVLVADSTGRAVGIAHASWRGTVNQVTTRLVEKLRAEFGCRPENLVAGISPSAGPCCYRVGAEVVDMAVRELGIMAERFFRVSGGKFIFDLWGANRQQLHVAGVPGDNITTAGVCTICHNQTYPSYRAEGDAAGRFVAAIGKKGLFIMSLRLTHEE